MMSHCDQSGSRKQRIQSFTLLGSVAQAICLATLTTGKRRLRAVKETWTGMGILGWMARTNAQSPDFDKRSRLPSVRLLRGREVEREALQRQLASVSSNEKIRLELGTKLRKRVREKPVNTLLAVLASHVQQPLKNSTCGPNERATTCAETMGTPRFDVLT